MHESKIEVVHGWQSKHLPLKDGCFHSMIPNHEIKHGCFTVSKWLVKKVTSHFMNRLTSGRGPTKSTNHGYNHSLNGMILQVDGFPLSDYWVIQTSVISAYQTNPNKWTTYLMIFCIVSSFQSGKKIRTIQETGDPARTYANVIKS